VRITTTYMEGERFVHVRMTVLEANQLAGGIAYVQCRFFNRLRKLLKGEAEISG
jgi:hypothetical protein